MTNTSRRDDSFSTVCHDLSLAILGKKMTDNRNTFKNFFFYYLPSIYTLGDPMVLSTLPISSVSVHGNGFLSVYKKKKTVPTVSRMGRRTTSRTVGVLINRCRRRATRCRTRTPRLAVAARRAAGEWCSGAFSCYPCA